MYKNNISYQMKPKRGDLEPKNLRSNCVTGLPPLNSDRRNNRDLD